MLRRKLLAGALSAVIAVSLCPVPAFAADLQAGASPAAASASTVGALATQAKKSVWVVSSIRSSSSSSYSSTMSKYYSYNSKGLVSSTSRSYGSSYSTTTQTLKYKGSNLSRITVSYSSSSDPTVYNFKSKNGRISTVTNKYSNGNNSSKYVYDYAYDSSGAVKTVKSAYYSYRNSNGSYSSKMKKRSSDTTKYSKFTKGHPQKAVTTSSSANGSKSTSAPTKYAYNGKGNRSLTRYGNGSPTIYSYTYEGGRVATMKYGSSSSTYHFTWKKISVPSSLASKVKAQQWSILNDNLNCAFGPVNLGI